MHWWQVEPEKLSQLSEIANSKRVVAAAVAVVAEVVKSKTLVVAEVVKLKTLVVELYSRHQRS